MQKLLCRHKLLKQGLEIIKLLNLFYFSKLKMTQIVTALKFLLYRHLWNMGMECIHLYLCNTGILKSHIQFFLDVFSCLLSLTTDNSVTRLYSVFFNQLIEHELSSSFVFSTSAHMTTLKEMLNNSDKGFISFPSNKLLSTPRKQASRIFVFNGYTTKDD